MFTPIDSEHRCSAVWTRRWWLFTFIDISILSLESMLKQLFYVFMLNKSLLDTNASSCWLTSATTRIFRVGSNCWLLFWSHNEITERNTCYLTSSEDSHCHSGTRMRWHTMSRDTRLGRHWFPSLIVSLYSSYIILYCWKLIALKRKKIKYLQGKLFMTIRKQRQIYFTTNWNSKMMCTLQRS